MGALNISPCRAAIGTGIQLVSCGSTTEGIQVPGRAGAQAKGNLLSCSKGRQLSEAGPVVGGLEDTLVRANVDLASDSRVCGNVSYGCCSSKCTGLCKRAASVRGDIKAS